MNYLNKEYDLIKIIKGQLPTSAHQTMRVSVISQAHCTRATVLPVEMDASRTPAPLVAASV